MHKHDWEVIYSVSNSLIDHWKCRRCRAVVVAGVYLQADNKEVVVNPLLLAHQGIELDCNDQVVKRILEA
jgi:hypothetical protein